MQDFPAWRHGPNGQSAVFESEEDVPSGWVDHPSKVKGFTAAEGTHTALAPTNGHVSAAEAAQTTTAKSQTHTPPEVAALTDPLGTGGTPPAKPPTLDADGHAFDPSLHAATATKTKAGLWRMKVGVTRPAPKPPLDL